MSNFKAYEPGNIDLKYISKNIQLSYDYGCDTDEESMERYLRHLIEGVYKVEFQYQAYTHLYVIKFVTKDNDKNEYHYQFFVKKRDRQ